MWKIVYNILITLCLPLFILLGLTRQKIRKNLFERILVPSKKDIRKGALWIHAASIGEAMIADNLVKYLHGRDKNLNFLITMNTYYTKDLLSKRSGSHVQVKTLPYDLLFSVRRFLDQTNPGALIIVETEIWPNLIWEAAKRNIPVVIVNGRISDSTLRNYLRFSFFIRKVLSRVDLVLAQSEEHAKRYIAIGMESGRVVNTGNIKYFRTREEKARTTEKEKIITLGSIKEKELDILYRAIGIFQKDFPDYRIFIAPRELHLASMIEKDLAPLYPVVRYSSRMTGAVAGNGIVIVDTIGDLMSIYAKSAVAFVGGSLAPYGGQNILEPLFFATPVLFGPHMENFREIARTVIESDAGIVVHNTEELVTSVTALLGDDLRRTSMGRRGQLIVEEQERVMEKTAGLIMTTVRDRINPS